MTVSDECRREAELHGWTFEVPKRNVYVMRKGRIEISYHPPSMAVSLIACPWRLSDWFKARQVSVTAFGCLLDTPTVHKVAAICSTLNELWLHKYFLDQIGRKIAQTKRQLAQYEEDANALLAVTPRDAN